MMNAGRETYRHLAEYNRRANSELYGAVAALTDRAWTRGDRTWFGSLQGLLNHALVGDMMWLRRFTPIHPESKVLADTRLAPAHLAWDGLLREDFDEMRAERAYVDDRIIDWFDECPETRYGTAFEYVDSVGNMRRARADAAFEFLFIHQIHHRGQAAQVLDELGVPNNLADNAAYLDPKS